MKDYFGNDLAVGDKVVMVSPPGGVRGLTVGDKVVMVSPPGGVRGLTVGEVVRLGKVMAIVRRPGAKPRCSYSGREYFDEWKRYPSDLVKYP